MKKYKYKVGEIVDFFCKSYDSNNYVRVLIVIDRIIKDNDIFYKCTKIEKEWYKDGLCLSEPIINKLDLFTLDVDTLIIDNLPLNFEYIPEKYLFKINTLKKDVPQCGNNGCEIITNLLEDNTPEETEENKEITFLNNCIERSQTLVNSYQDAIWGLKKLIEEECISINKLKNKIAILTDDPILYTSTFIDTIED